MTESKERERFNPDLTWFIPMGLGESGLNMNPTHKNNQGCEVSPKPFGCLVCPLKDCAR